MTHDQHLVPARTGRDEDIALADLAQGGSYPKYARYGAAPNDVNVKEYLHVILKRKWLILSIMLVITSLSTVLAFRDPATYEGATTIRIEPRPQNVLATGGFTISEPTDQNFWGTQLKLLRNPSLARHTVWVMLCLLITTLLGHAYPRMSAAIGIYLPIPPVAVRQMLRLAAMGYGIFVLARYSTEFTRVANGALSVPDASAKQDELEARATNDRPVVEERPLQ